MMKKCDKLADFMIWVVFNMKLIIVTITCILMTLSIMGIGYIVWQVIKPH